LGGVGGHSGQRRIKRVLGSGFRVEGWVQMARIVNPESRALDLTPKPQAMRVSDGLRWLMVWRRR
jgi:hypothetical protein